MGVWHGGGVGMLHACGHAACMCAWVERGHGHGLDSLHGCLTSGHGPGDICGCMHKWDKEWACVRWARVWMRWAEQMGICR